MSAARALVVGSCLAACGEVLPASPTEDAGTNGADATTDASNADAGDASASCSAETCDGRTACSLTEFTSSCGSFVIDNANPSAVIAECKDGVLHIAGGSTLDAIATIKQMPPTAGYSAIRVSFRLWAERWDGKRAALISLANASRAMMLLEWDRFDTLTVKLCKDDAGDCVTPPMNIPTRTDHRYTFEIDATTTRLFVDCVELASFPTLGFLEKAGELKLEFGHRDMTEINGEYDDVMLWFKPL